MLRLFFALQPSADQNEALVAAAAPLIAELGAQRVPAENFHATLCFIGAVEPEKLESLRAAAAQVRGRPATLHFDALDYWEEPKILCATASEGAAASPAHELAQALGDAALAAGFTPDIKPFRAHLTVARKVGATNASQHRWPSPLSETLVVRCDRFFLMESRRGESGSIYSALDSWPLYIDESD